MIFPKDPWQKEKKIYMKLPHVFFRHMYDFELRIPRKSYGQIRHEWPIKEKKENHEFYTLKNTLSQQNFAFPNSFFCFNEMTYLFKHTTFSFQMMRNKTTLIRTRVTNPMIFLLLILKIYAWKWWVRGCNGLSTVTHESKPSRETSRSQKWSSSW